MKTVALQALGVIPLSIPLEIRNTGETVSGNPGDILRTDAPGVEVDGRWNDKDYAVVVLAVADGDWEQWAFMQVSHRPAGQRHYDGWNFVFCSRGGDSSWEEWQADLCFTERPTWAAFGQYIDSTIKEHN